MPRASTKQHRLVSEHLVLLHAQSYHCT